jgi:hypothetical protein
VPRSKPNTRKLAQKKCAPQPLNAQKALALNNAPMPDYCS